METKQTNNKKRKKQSYKNNTKLICTEFILLDKDEKLVADFKTREEAIDYKNKNKETEIYMLKTFKLK